MGNRVNHGSGYDDQICDSLLITLD